PIICAPMSPSPIRSASGTTGWWNGPARRWNRGAGGRPRRRPRARTDTSGGLTAPVDRPRRASTDAQCPPAAVRLPGFAPAARHARMPILILLRHARAEASRPGQSDHERILAPRGQREAAAMGRAVASRGWRPDRVIASTAARTRQTWAEAAPALPAVG